ncbi:MAG: tetratricopeptide repeat protein [Planctomycetaceae bacterium]|nr:tetratricopeptide repeat protein [Planctomycetaceae bacterium]
MMQLNKLPRLMRAGLFWLLAVCFLPAPVTSLQAAPADDEYTLGLTLYGQQRWDLARETFESYLKSFPNHEQVPLAKLYLAQSLINLQKYQEARTVLRQFLKDHAENKNVPQAMYRVAESSYFLDDYESAITEFQAFLKRAPEDQLVEWALPYLADAYLREGKAAEAEKQFRASLKAYPEGRFLDDSRFGLARSLELQNKTGDARQQYNQIIDEGKSKRIEEALFNLGMLAFQDRDYTTASQTFLKLVEKAPEGKLAPLAHLNAGYAFYSLQDWKQAQEQFTEAEQNASYRETARYWVALTLKSSGAVAEAEQELQALIRRMPEEDLLPKIKYQIGDCQYQLANYAEALNTFRDYLKDFPQGESLAEAWLSYIECCLLTDDYAEGWRVISMPSTPKLNSTQALRAELLESRLLMMPAGIQKPVPAELGDETERLAKAWTILADQIAAHEMDYSLTLQQVRYQAARIAQQKGDHAAAIGVLDPVTRTLPKDNVLQMPECWVLLANSEYELKQYDAALKALDAFDQIQEKSAGVQQASIIRLNVFMALERYDDAAALLPTLKSQQIDQESIAKATYQLAEHFYGNQQWATAQNLYLELIGESVPVVWRSKALSGLGWSYFEAGEFDKATARFEELAREFPGDQQAAADAGYMSGMALLKGNQVKPAAETFLKTARRFASDDQTETGNEIHLIAYKAAREAARAFRQLNDIAQASESYLVAYQELRKQPAPKKRDLDKLLDEWALLHYEAQQYEKADEIFQKLVTETPNSDRADDASLSLAESEFISGKLKEARSRLETLLASNQADPYVTERSLYQLVMIAVSQKDTAAIQQFSLGYLKAAGADSSLSERGEIQTQLAQLYLEQNQPEKVQELLDDLSKRLEGVTVAERPVWAPRVDLMKGELARQQKKYQLAVEALDRLVKDYPESPERDQLEVIVGRTQIAQARFPEARQTFENVLARLDGKKTLAAAQSQFYLAEVALIAKDYPTAIREYIRTAILFPGFPDLQSAALYQAGQCDEVLGNKDQALQNYQNLTRLYPESEFAEKAQSRIDALSKPQE